MGLIREPKGIDFTVINKPFSEAEKREFSLLIKAEKMKRKRSMKKVHKRKNGKAIA